MPTLAPENNRLKLEIGNLRLELAAHPMNSLVSVIDAEGSTHQIGLVQAVRAQVTANGAPDVEVLLFKPTEGFSATLREAAAHSRELLAKQVPWVRVVEKTLEEMHEMGLDSGGEAF